MQKSVKRINKFVLPMLAIVFFYFVLEAFGVTCPIKFVTGVSCAGCGMSRAWIALLHFDIKTAFYYHPLFWTPPLFLLLVGLKRKINIHIYQVLIAAMISLYVIVYIVRLVNKTDSIVVFEPQNNLLFQLIRYLRK